MKIDFESLDYMEAVRLKLAAEEEIKRREDSDQEFEKLIKIEAEKFLKRRQSMRRFPESW